MIHYKGLAMASLNFSFKCAHCSKENSVSIDVEVNGVPVKQVIDADDPLNKPQTSDAPSLASLFPNIACDWHPRKNGDISPSQVGAKVHRKAWWKCPEGPDHEWEASVYTRTRNGTGCPFCRGKSVSVTNSLAALYPDIAAEWHPGRNDKLTPDQVSAGSNKLVWWSCSKGSDHEWQSRIVQRSVGHGCPMCTGRQVSVTNSLASLYPELAAQWHSNKNGELTPKSVVSGSRRKVWWQCSIAPDHQWDAMVSNRTKLGTGCPFCSRRSRS